MARPTPWWETIRLRDEIASASGAIEDVQMSLFNAVHGVAGRTVAYADARYYADITFPSASLIELMAQIAVRLGAQDSYEAVRAMWRLDQGMGGGKSHGLIGMYHLAANTGAFTATEVGQAVMASAEKIAGKGNVAADLNRPRVVVLSCDNMTPGKGDKDIDGPADTLGERFLWRLFDGAPKLWSEYRADAANKSRLAEAIDVVGRPVLILVDEVMDYVRKAAAAEQTDLVVQDMAFLRALLDTVNDVPNCAMVLVMIASDKESIVLNDLGERCRAELEDLLVRNARTATVTTANDFAEIIRRRLFEKPPPAEVLSATARQWLDHVDGDWRRVLSRAGLANDTEFAAKVARSYPFHPSLIDLAENEWSLSTGFQRVRSTIQIFAATVFAQQRRAARGEWVPGLIGVGDLPLSARDVRDGLLNSGLVPDQRTTASYREIASTEVVADDDQRGTARQFDLKRTGHAYLSSNPRAAERAATALFVYSIGQRPQGRQGATEAELKAAAFVPDISFGEGDADVVVTELRSPDDGLAALEEIPGRGGQPLRLFLSTRQTLNMLVRAQRNAIGDQERDKQLADMAWDLAKTGPFNVIIPVDAGSESDPRSLRDVLEAAGIDDARKNRLAVLDPRRFSLLNGIDEETRAAIRAALGLGDDRLAVGWASSAVFAVVNTQRRANARKLTVEYLARKRVADIDAVRTDEDLARKAREDLTEARKRLEEAIRDAYQHVIYLGEDPQGNRADKAIRFDKKGQSSLNGDTVWAALCDADKAFARSEFDAQALLHNLRDSDYGRPLSEIRDSFWNTPRLPLLPEGEEDLRRAIYQAVRNGDLVLVDHVGSQRTAETPADINMSSAGLRLAKPGAAQVEDAAVPNVVGRLADQARSVLGSSGFTADGAATGTITAQQPAGGELAPVGSAVMLFAETTPGPGTGPEEPDYLVSVTLNSSLTDEERGYAVRMLLSALGEAVDGDAAHIQMTVKITAPADARDRIIERAKQAGAQQATFSEL
jgi:Protein of unknown function (DUF499)/PASTA domain